MKIEEIRRRVNLIKKEAWDAEKAHTHEDALYRDLLIHIRANAPDPYSAMAAEALKTLEIDFPRWCA